MLLKQVADAAIASVLSELGSISSLKEKQRTTLMAFLNRKKGFADILTDFGKSLIYQKVPLVIRFVDLTGRS